MFRVPLLIAVALLIAFGGGIGSTISALNASAGAGGIHVGAWAAYPLGQTEAADPYAKSHRARAGLLLLGSAEGLTFSATEDDDGERLTGTCSYRIHGTTPQARAWTLFAADLSGQPLPIPQELPAAYNSRTVLREPDGSFAITLSPTAKPMNWLALPDTGYFTLILRLLDTPAAGNSGLLDLDIPNVEKIGCGHE